MVLGLLGIFLQFLRHNHVVALYIRNGIKVWEKRRLSPLFLPQSSR